MEVEGNPSAVVEDLYLKDTKNPVVIRGVAVMIGVVALMEKSSQTMIGVSPAEEADGTLEKTGVTPVILGIGVDEDVEVEEVI